MTNSQKLSDFRSKFKIDDLAIISIGSWTWSLRPAQATLGTGILSLNRYALKLSELNSSEYEDMHKIISVIEQSLNSAFNYNILNYLALMMVDHHVHFHVIPRYDSERKFAELSWVDNGWPALPNVMDSQHGDNADILPQIRDHLKQS